MVQKTKQKQKAHASAEVALDTGLKEISPLKLEILLWADNGRYKGRDKESETG